MVRQSVIWTVIYDPNSPLNPVVICHIQLNTGE